MDGFIMANAQKKPYALKHKDCKDLVIVNGKWGPHTKKVICLNCDGAFVMWAKKSYKN